MSITIEPIVYSTSHLHAVYCAPEKARTGVLLLSPLFEEKRCAHRALVTCARALAEAGAAVLIPDLTGTGNSPGALAEIDVEQWRHDIAAAAGALRQRAGDELRLAGCRLGALLASRAANSLHVTRLVLWQPIISGKMYLRQVRMRRMIQDSITGEPPPIGEHELDGLEVSPALYAGLEAMTIPDAPPCREVRLLQCSFNEHPLAEYARLADRWGGVPLRCLEAEPFWNAHTPGPYPGLGAALAGEVLS